MRQKGSGSGASGEKCQAASGRSECCLIRVVRLVAAGVVFREASGTEAKRVDGWMSLESVRFGSAAGAALGWLLLASAAATRERASGESEEKPTSNSEDRRALRRQSEPTRVRIGQKEARRRLLLMQQKSFLRKTKFIQYTHIFNISSANLSARACFLRNINA